MPDCCPSLIGNVQLWTILEFTRINWYWIRSSMNMRCKIIHLGIKSEVNVDFKASLEG